MAVLVIAQSTVAVVRAVAPELPDRQLRSGLVKVVTQKPRVKSSHKVQAPAVRSRPRLKPFKPLGVVSLHSVLCVIYIRRCVVDSPRGRGSAAPVSRAVVRYHARVPLRRMAEHVPRAVLVLK